MQSVRMVSSVLRKILSRYDGLIYTVSAACLIQHCSTTGGVMFDVVERPRIRQRLVCPLDCIASEKAPTPMIRCRLEHLAALYIGEHVLGV